ncbi:MAG TPA: hypothetical protein VHG28_12020 [Longimicrobiaceae bacterium]|nr:hypothetical protein [Longimicrobiaceae bacterium]
MAGWAGLLCAALVVWAAATWIPVLRPLRVPIAVAFAVRCVTALVHVYVAPLPDSSGDALGFEVRAWEWSRNGFVAALSRFESGAFMYSWFGALLYSITGRSPLLLASANVLAGAMVAGVTGALAGELAGERAARRTCWVVAFFPTLVLYSAMTVREAWIILFLVCGAFCAARWQRGGGRIWIWVAVASLLAGSGLNSALLAATAVVVMEALVHETHRFSERPTTRAVLVLAGAACVVLCAAALAAAWGRENLVWVIRPERFARVQMGFATGRTAYLQGLYVDSPWDLLWQTPIRAVVFLFGFPLPPETRMDVLAMLDALVYVALVVLIGWRMRVLWHDRAMRALLGTVVGVTLLFAIFTGNHGTALRHRAKVAPLAVALVAAAWAVTSPTPRRRTPRTEESGSPG